MPLPGSDVLASPAKVVRKLLTDEGLGVLPGVDQADPGQTLLVDQPQIFVSSLPADVNLAVLLKDVVGPQFGSDMGTGNPWEHPGVSCTVRSPDDYGYTLAYSCYAFLGRVKNTTVTLGRYRYNIQNVNRTRPVMDIGEEEETKRQRWVFEVAVVFQDPPRTVVEE